MTNQTLTIENIKVGLVVKNEYGTWTIGKDENGWTVNGRSGSKMLFEYDFKYWEVV